MLDLNYKSTDYCLAVSDLADIVIDMLKEAPPAKYLVIRQCVT